MYLTIQKGLTWEYHVCVLTLSKQLGLDGQHSLKLLIILQRYVPWAYILFPLDLNSRSSSSAPSKTVKNWRAIICLYPDVWPLRRYLELSWIWDYIITFSSSQQQLRNISWKFIWKSFFDSLTKHFQKWNAFEQFLSLPVHINFIENIKQQA